LGFKNARFGKIEAHQTVCAFAREFLMRSAEIAKKYGCKIIHGIVDSMWLQDTENRNPEEFEKVTKKLAQEITEETRIPMSWDGRFNIIVFLPSRAEPDVPALSHYWGIKSNNEIKVRGIEVRRRDIPKIVKDAQYAFIDLFKGSKSVEEFRRRIPRAKELFYEYVNLIENGNLTKEDLSIRQRISRRPSQYKVNSYQAIAAKQMENSGVIASAGKNVRYIILDANADPAFPERKVILSDLYEEKRHHYDKEKYIEILKRAFENLFPMEFPELEEVLDKKNNRKFTQKDLSCYLGG
jgi:DNA polymerase-2